MLNTLLARTLRGLTLAAMLAVPATDAAAQLRRVPVTLETLVESDGVRAGSTVRAVLQVTLPEGLHVQSNKPRDPALIPTELLLEPPTGVRGVEVVFPKAVDFAQEGLPEPLLVFDRQFTIGVQLAVAADLAPGAHAVPFTLRYQACDDKVCFAPSSAKGEWTVDVVPANAAVAALHGEVFGAIPFGTGEAPAQAAPVFTPAATTPTAAGGDGLAALDRFTVVATTGGYLGTGDFMTFIQNAEAGVTEQGLFEGRGPMAILLLVLVGGLALNLTPCVLPMIPINLAIIGAGAQAGSRQRGFLLGLTYGAAMAFVYGVLGLIVVLTASTFGTINASPWFNLGIAVLFVALALAMFDVFEIDFSRFSGGLGGGARGSFTLAFTMGAVAALLAGACVAPVVIQVVLFASNLYATGTSVALALPFFLGIGMAIPWPFAGAGLASLPKPGPWMVRVKQAFGVLILGTAVLLRLPGLRPLRQPVRRRRRGVVERRRKAQGRLARLAGRGPGGGRARGQAGAHRHVGHLVQELPDHGQDDAGRPGGHRGAQRLRQGEVPGRAARRAAGRRADETLQGGGPAGLRDYQAELRQGGPGRLILCQDGAACWPSIPAPA